MTARFCSLLENKLLLIQTSTALVQLTRPFAGRNASQTTAEIVLEMLACR
jgi:hypothetical protein